MAKSGKPRRPIAAPQGPPAEDFKGGRPGQPRDVEAEQTREAEEGRRARDADASKSVKKKHAGGR